MSETIDTERTRDQAALTATWHAYQATTAYREIRRRSATHDGAEAALKHAFAVGYAAAIERERRERRPRSFALWIAGAVVGAAAAAVLVLGRAAAFEVGS